MANNGTIEPISDVKRVHVLLVTETPNSLTSLATYLETKYGYLVVDAAFSKIVEFLDQVHRKFEVVVLDASLINTGVPVCETIRGLKAAHSTTEIIVLSANSINEGISLLHAGAYRYFLKDYDADEVALTVRVAAERAQLRLQEATILALNGIATAANAARDLETILYQACQVALTLVTVDHSGVFLFDSDMAQGKFVAQYPSGPGDSMSVRAIQVKGTPLEERLINRKQALNVEDVQKERNLGPLQDILVASGIRSTLITPIILRGRVIGFLSLNNKHYTRRFDSEEVQVCQRLADQIALATGSVSVLNARDRALYELNRLYEAINLIATAPDALEALNRSVRAAWEATGAWGAELRLLDETGRQQTLVFSGQENVTTWSGIMRQGGISHLVFGSKKAIFIEDTEAVSDDIDADMLKHHVQAAACLPLQVVDRSIGVLWIHFRTKRGFPQEERRVLQIYADLCASAYDKLSRIQELEAMREASEALITTSSISGANRQIVQGAAKIANADYVLFWPYDESRKAFSQQLYSNELSSEWLERFKKSQQVGASFVDHILSSRLLQFPTLMLFMQRFGASPLIELLQSLRIRSLVGCGLSVDHEDLGVLILFYKEERALPIDYQRNLETFCLYAALSLRSAKLFDQLYRAREIATIVAHVTSVAKDVESPWRSLIAAVKSYCDCDAVVLYRYNASSNKLDYPPFMLGIQYEERVTKSEAVEHNSLAWRVIKRGKWLIVEDAASQPFTQALRFIREEGIKAFIGIPLMAGDTPVGCLLVTFRSPHRFSDAELDQLRNHTDELARSIQDLYMLEAHTGAPGALSLDETLQQIAKQAHYSLDVAHYEEAFSHVALVEADRLEFVATSPPEILGILQQTSPEIELKGHTSAVIGVAGRAVRTGLVQHVRDVSSDKDFIRFPTPIKTRSQLSVPISTQSGRVIGVISVEHKEPNIFSSEDIRHIKLLATQASLVIQSARMLSANTQLAWIGMLSTVWRHNLEGTAISIADEADLLHRQVDKYQIEPEIKNLVEQRLTAIKKLVHELTRPPATYLLSSNEGVRVISANQIIRSAIEGLKQYRRNQHISTKQRLAADAEVLIEVDPEWFHHALDILINNAVEAMSSMKEQRKHPRLVFSTQPTNGGVELTITDTGEGIPPQMLRHIFYEPIIKPSRTKGLGIGLLLVQLIVRRFGGDIQVKSTGLKGTTIAIWLPSATTQRWQTHNGVGYRAAQILTRLRSGTLNRDNNAALE